MKITTVNTGWGERPNWAAFLRDQNDPELVLWMTEGHKTEQQATQAATWAATRIKP